MLPECVPGGLFVLLVRLSCRNEHHAGSRAGSVPDFWLRSLKFAGRKQVIFLLPLKIEAKSVLNVQFKYGML